MERGLGANKVYIVIAFAVILLIIITILFSNNNLTVAYIENKYISEVWKDSGNSSYDERLFGLEKQASITYVVDENLDDNYPAYLTVTTFKTLFMISEDELIRNVKNTIKNEAENINIDIDYNSSVQNSRVLKNGHKSQYIIYNGTDFSGDISEEIKIIGETWNCPISGTSIICIGISQITNKNEGNNSIFLNHWNEMISDPQASFGREHIGENGLIFNVKCH